VAKTGSSNAIDPARLGDAIACIWEAAADSERWSEALQGLNALMPECHGFLAMTPFAEGSGTFWKTHNPPAGFLEAYYANWLGRDTTLHAIARRMPMDTLIGSFADIAPEDCAIWNEFYRPHGIQDAILTTVNGGAAGGAEAVLIGGFAERRKDAESRRRKSVMQALARHLGGAAALHWRFVHAQSEAAATKSILDRLSLGIVTLSAAGHVLEANRAARRILDSARDIALRQAAALRRLDAAIAAVLAGGAERPLQIDRADGGVLHVIVAPMAVDIDQRAGSKAKAILFISDPAQMPDRAGARIAALYGLTPAEAAVAEAIAAGAEPGKIAERRGTSIATVRTQLKSVMAKLGAARQSDVVRSVLAVPVLGPG
jgi:DNA-binding CsgD family transcriptional regulator/PAS domain-containing protein